FWDNKNNERNEEIFESTEQQREGTEEKVESTAGQIDSTEDQTKEEIPTQASQTYTQSPTSMIFGDDETIATLLINMSKAKAASKEKEKGVELKDVEEIDRPRPTSQRSLLTLKPLPKIDPKDKGKKKIEEEDESESEDDDIPQVVKKFKQLESDEVLARKIQEEWEEEEERNKIAEEEATNEALIKNFDDIKARIEADRILAEKLQEQEREQFTIEERAKFLHDTIAAQRKFLAKQRSEAIRNRPPTKNQLRNQMMTYLKHVGNFKHSELKSKKFEDIQAMYEKIKRSDEDFIAIGSVEDDKLITKMNKKDSSKEEEIKQESKVEVKEEDEGEENTRKRKHGTRKKMKSRKRRYIQDTSQDDSSDIEKENEELRLCLTIAPDEDKEVDYEILDKKYPIIDWKTESLGTKPQFDESKRLEEINLNVVTRSNGQKRYFSTLMTVLSVFDREDLDAVYKLVMDIYQDKIPEEGRSITPPLLLGERIAKSKSQNSLGKVHLHSDSGCKDPFSFILGPSSKLLGVVVSEDRVVQAANRIGCGVLKAPFAYLGSKVGGNMSRTKSWDEIVDKMVDRLSKWKMKTSSIGGRLTILKAVLGSMPIYHMSIFKGEEHLTWSIRRAPRRRSSCYKIMNSSNCDDLHGSGVVSLVSRLMRSGIGTPYTMVRDVILVASWLIKVIDNKQVLPKVYSNFDGIKAVPRARLTFNLRGN
ncbi:hypothetical protein Tco_0805433, partial [Tanacetum coccineum]